MRWHDRIAKVMRGAGGMGSAVAKSMSAMSIRIEFAAVLVLGLAAFLAVAGAAPLDATSIGWLYEGDAATNYLGWAFFRTSPWSWPLAANPAYGMDIAGSVMMADANPLLALPFKLLSPLLPAQFQYFGWWLLACFLLQALFARAIAVRIGAQPEQRLAIAALFLFAPCFLIRIATPGLFHITLCGQWQILAALWLYLSPCISRRAIRWAALLAIAVLTHAYLLAIVAPLWLADVLRSLLARERPVGAIVGGAILVTGTALLIGQLSGVFWLRRASSASAENSMMSYGQWGFGIFKSNILSPVDAGGWSWLLPDLPSAPGELEGFAYLGLGVLLIGAVAIVLARRTCNHLRVGPEHIPLLLVLACFAVFAVTPEAVLGAYHFHLPWPAPLIGLGNLFRSSGRFAWPLVYGAMIAICWIAIHGSSRRGGSALLIAAAIIQIADSSAGWRGHAETFARPGPDWPTQLVSPFWGAAGHRYRAVRTIVPHDRPPLYRDIDRWALTYGMSTDLVYLARYDSGAFNQLAQRRAAELKEGRLARDTLWIADGVPTRVFASLAIDESDFAGTVDGVAVYAPGYRRTHP